MELSAPLAIRIGLPFGSFLTITLILFRSLSNPFTPITSYCTNPTPRTYKRAEEEEKRRRGEEEKRRRGEEEKRRRGEEEKREEEKTSQVKCT
jgi:hypothetical protein